MMSGSISPPMTPTRAEALAASLFCTESPTFDRRMSHPPINIESTIRLDLSLEVLDKKVVDIVQGMEEKLGEITSNNKQKYQDLLKRDRFSPDSIEKFMRDTDALTRELNDLEVKIFDETELLGALAQAQMRENY